jgi:CubicO group peptidase (beta-lactamase class C family)
MLITLQIRSVLLLTLAITALVAGPRAQAQDRSAEIDQIFSWTMPTTPGCACVVSQNGKVVVNRAYGSADLGHNTPTTPGTIFDAGSLQKQFVAAAALILVEDGKVSLSD